MKRAKAARAFALVIAGLAGAGSARAAFAPEGPPARAVRPTARGSEFDRLSRQAAQARAAGRLEEATVLYRKALGLKPAWLEGHWALATLLYDRDVYAEARDHFGHVVAGRPADGLALALKALCEVRLHNYDLALRELQQASTLGVTDKKVRSVMAFHMALLLNRAGQPDVAFSILRGLALNEEDSPPLLEAFGLSLLRLTYMPDEIPAEKHAMVALAGRGGYHMARGRHTEVGRLALEELVSRYPAQANVHYALGLYLTPEEPDSAIEEFRRELRASPAHYPALLRIALIEIGRGNAAEGRALAEQAVGLAPEVPAGRLTLGRALLELGETERAVAELEKGAALAPESRDMQFSLARAYQRAGRAADAERARQEFLRLERAAGAQDAEGSGAGRQDPPGGR